jgi:hypothetical protein
MPLLGSPDPGPMFRLNPLSWVLETTPIPTIYDDERTKLHSTYKDNDNI